MSQNISSNITSNKDSVNIIVVGDEKVGKTSLISTLISQTFDEQVPSVLQRVIVPPELIAENIALSVVDTSSHLHERSMLIQQLLWSDVILLACSYDNQESFKRARSYWLRLFADVGVEAPVVLALTKSDLKPQELCEEYMELLNDLNIESYVECSAKRVDNLDDAFFQAYLSFFYPIRPLYDANERVIKTKLVKIFNRIYRVFDCDHDNLWNDEELKQFQRECFEVDLSNKDIASMKDVISEQSSDDCVTPNGITFPGLLLLIRTLIERRRSQTIWRVVMQFGCDESLNLREDYIQLPLNVVNRSFDQSCELTDEAIEYLIQVFHTFDSDKDGGLSNQTRTIPPPNNSYFGESELEDVFAAAPRIPFLPDYTDTYTTNSHGHLDLRGWLSHWSMMTLSDPTATIENLVYLGYPIQSIGDAVRVNTSKYEESNSNYEPFDRKSILVLVYGLSGCGKTTLLKTLINKKFPDDHSATDRMSNTANYIPLPSGGNDDDEPTYTNKHGHFMVLQEISDNDKEVSESLQKDGLANQCDLICLLYDGHNPVSLDYIDTLLPKLPIHIPVVVLRNKDDLKQNAIPSEISNITQYDVATSILSLKHDNEKYSGLNHQHASIFDLLIEATLNPSSFRPVSPRKAVRDRVFRFIKILSGIGIIGSIGYGIYQYILTSSSPTITNNNTTTTTTK